MGADHLNRQLADWSPAREADLVAPGPGGLNRALREVAPHLAPDDVRGVGREAAEGRALVTPESRPAPPITPAPPQPEPDRCTNGGPHSYGSTVQGGPDEVCVVCWKDAPPAPAAPGEMSREASPAVVASVYRTFRGMLSEIDSKLAWMRGSITEVEEEYGKVRASRDEERARADRAEASLEIATTAHENTEAVLLRERDEAREQREDLANEILAERSDLAAANARAEEAERAYERLRDISLCRLQFPDGVVPGGTEECAHGWHDWYEKENAAHAVTKERLAAAEAERDAWRSALRSRFADCPDDPEMAGTVLGAYVRTTDSATTTLRARLAAAEAEVARLKDSRLAEEQAAFARGTRIARERVDALEAEVAALRASVARLVEAGEPLESLVRRCRSIMYDGAEVDKALAKWAVAKAQVKP